MSDSDLDGNGSGMAEGGGSGGGSHSVEEERRIVSPWRGVSLVFIIILALVVIIVPVLWVFGYLSLGVPYGGLWAVLSVIAVIVAVFVIYSMLKKNV